jgi:hypothetical protein
MSLRDRFRPAPAPAPDPEVAEARAAAALAAQRGRFLAPAAPNAARPVARLMRGLVPKGSMGLSALADRWAEFVGEPFAAICTPVKFSRGVLVLAVPSARAPAIKHNEAAIIARLNTAGVKVTALRIEQRTAKALPAGNVRPLRQPLTAGEETALAQALDQVGDDSLKSALMRLGRAVKQG